MHKQLSKIYLQKLFLPHYFGSINMDINRFAHHILANVQGFREFWFVVGRHSIELSNNTKKQWRASYPGLPINIRKSSYFYP